MSIQPANTKNDSIVIVKNFICNVLSSTQDKIQQNLIEKKVPLKLANLTNSQIYQTFLPINQISQQKSTKIQCHLSNICKKQTEKGFCIDQSPSFIQTDNLAVNTIKTEKKPEPYTKVKLVKKNSSCYSKTSQKKMNICALRSEKLFNGCQSNYSTLKSIYSSKKDPSQKFQKIGYKKAQIIPIFFAQQEQSNFQFKKRKQMAQDQQNTKIQNQQNMKKTAQFALKSSKTKKIMDILQSKGKSLSYDYDGQILNLDKKQIPKQDQIRISQLRKTVAINNSYTQKDDIRVIAKQVKYQIKDKANQQVNNQSEMHSFVSFDLSQYQQLQLERKPKIFKKHSRISKTSRYGMQENEVAFYNNYKRQTSCIPYTEISEGVKIQEKTAQDKQVCIEKIKMPTQSREQYMSKTTQFSFRSYLPLNSKSNSIMLDKTNNKFDYQKVQNFGLSGSNFKSQTLYVRPKTTQNVKKIQKFKTDEWEYPKTQDKKRHNLETSNKGQLKSYTQRQFRDCKTSRIKSILWNQKRERIIKKQTEKIWKNEQLYKTLQF